MPDGGRLVIKAVPEGRRAKVTISDTGEGLDQDAVDNLSSEARVAIKDIIPKPTVLEDLNALLAKMLRKEIS